MPEVLLVSRPYRVGAADATSDQVAALASAGRRFRYRVLTALPSRPPAPGVATRVAALPGLAYGPTHGPLTLLALARGQGEALRHFLFTPTPLTVWLLRGIGRRHRGPTVQTLCSVPRRDGPLGPLLFADRVIVLSAHTQARLLAEGVPASRVVRIAPALPAAPAPTPALRAAVRARLGLRADAALVVYLGDYDTEGAALTVAAAAGPLTAGGAAHLVLACRPKGPRHAEVAVEVSRRIAALGPGAAAVRLPGAIAWARDLARAADIAVFPAGRLPDKMDLPLALLASLEAGVPAVVASSGPLAELVAAGAARGVAPGDGAGLAAAVRAWLADPGARARAGARAYSFARAETDPAHVGERHEAIYAGLLPGR